MEWFEPDAVCSGLPTPGSSNLEATFLYQLKLLSGPSSKAVSHNNPLCLQFYAMKEEDKDET